MQRCSPASRRHAGSRRARAAALAVTLIASIAVPFAVPAPAVAAEPAVQYPFACTTERAGLGQPKVDNQDGDGVTVYAVDDKGVKTDEVVGWSRDCDADTQTWYYAVDTKGDRHVVRANGAAAPTSIEAIEAMLPQGRGLATTEVVDVEGVTEVPYLVRHERGVINRFIYSISMLAPQDEVLAAEPVQSDELWNGRLLYQFQGGVGIGFSQGAFSERRAIFGEPDRLGKGYAVIYSTGTSTGDHYNLLVGGRTAVKVKDHFVDTFGEPRYTVGVGGSGGGIQQYVYNQNHPDLLDAAIPQRSYSDMTTQTIHIGDCSLIERWMDVDAASDPTWKNWDNREWIEGLNTIDGYLGDTGAQLAQLQAAMGQTPQTGSSECLEGWFGLAPLAMNPKYGSETGWDLLGDQVADIEKNHWSDAREAYGTDPETGFARVPWDNVGVQYGLQALVDGDITAEQFLDLNARIGSWKDPQDMVQEGFPFVGSVAGLPGNYDPWSARNMNLSPDGGVTPAPRRTGDVVAIQNAYRSGLVNLGAPPREIPIIEARDNLEQVLNMHNSHQSFAVRERMIENQGDADNQAIWWLKTDAEGDSPYAADFYNRAFDTIDQWISNLEADPEATVAEARPEAAADTCFEVDGDVIASGNDVWDGVLDGKPAGACTSQFEIHSTSRIVAGGPITGDVYKCRTMPVATAVDEGLYGDWAVDATTLARLQQIHPEGVCDYALAGVGDPRTDVPGGIEATGGAGRLDVRGAEPGASVLLRSGGETVASTTAGPDGHATFTGRAAGAYVVAQVVDEQRGLLSAPVTVTVTVSQPGPGSQPGPVIVPASQLFPDVAPGSVHEAAITRLATDGVLLGFKDGSFGPARPTSRAQMASVLQRALGLEPVPTGPFPDVPAGSVHSGAINALAAAGIVQGRKDGTFDGSSLVSRGQLATMLANAGDLQPTGTVPFDDVAGNTHATTIDAVYAAGVVEGFPDGSFRPDGDVNRAQTASMVVRLLDVMAEQD